MKELSRLEMDFVFALNEFASGDETKRDGLFITYNRLCASLSDEPEIRNRKLSLMISALIDALDMAPDGEISSVLYSYLFGDFLENYSEEKVVQEAIKGYTGMGRLNKLPLQIALSRRLTQA